MVIAGLAIIDSYSGRLFLPDKEFDVRILLLGVMFLFFIFVTPVFAGSLGKYTDEPSAPAYQQQFSPEEVKRRLNNKMERAINILNAMDDDEKQKWIAKYKQKMAAAEADGDYLKSSYYRGILEQVE